MTRGRVVDRPDSLLPQVNLGAVWEIRGSVSERDLRFGSGIFQLTLTGRTSWVPKPQARAVPKSLPMQSRDFRGL